MSPFKILEAPGGFEPSNGGFADLSLSHLGTAPFKTSYKLEVRKIFVKFT